MIRPAWTSRSAGAPEAGGRGRLDCRRRRGFTLVEMLIVVAIIALLVTIVSPLAAGVRERARVVICANNLHVLQTSMMEYTVANGFKNLGYDYRFSNWVDDGFYEVWWGDKGRKNIMNGLMWPYINSFPAYMCPTFDIICREPPSGAEWRPGVPYGQAYASQPETITDWKNFDPVRSYSLNEYIGYGIRSLFKADNLDKRVWLCDENPWRQLYLYPTVIQSYGINNGHLGGGDTPGEYHTGKANAAMGDGHVELKTPPDILNDVKASGW